MRKQNKNKNGFTLIELALYVSLVSLLTLGISSFFSIIKQVEIKNKSISAVEEQGAFVADILSEKIRQAKGVCVPVSSGISGSTDNLDLDSDCISYTSDRVRFALDGNDLLQITEGSGSPVLLVDSRVYISSLSFIKAQDPLGGPPSVNYTFTMQARSHLPNSEFRYSKDFSGGGTIR